MALYSVSEAAVEAGLSGKSIRQAIANGQIRAVKVEGMWLVESDSLRDYMATPRKPGRPRKDA